MDTKAIRAWLSRQAFDSEGLLVKVTVYHVTSDHRIGAEVLTVKADRNIAAEWVNESADEIAEELENDAAALGVNQAYSMVGYFRDGDSKAEKRAKLRAGPRKVIRVNGDQGGEKGDSMATEPPNPLGLVAQAQRHTEAFARMSINHFANIMAKQADMIDRLSALAESGFESRVQMIGLIEELSSGKHVRDMEMEGLKLKQKAKQEALDSVLPLLPAVINKLVGKEIAVEKRDPLVIAVAGLFRSISADQAEAVLAPLNPPQRATLLTILETVNSSNGGVPSLAAIDGGRKS